MGVTVQKEFGNRWEQPIFEKNKQTNRNEFISESKFGTIDVSLKWLKKK